MRGPVITIDDVCEKLRGPLELERRHGFTDTAVSGGLGPYVLRWTQNVCTPRERGKPDSRLEQMRRAFAGYGPADRRRRGSLVEAALALLDELERASAAPVSTSTEPAWDAPLTTLRGIGPARAAALAAAGIHTVGDLLSFHPLRYIDRPRLHRPDEVRERQEALLRVRITGRGSNFFRGRVKMTTVPAVALEPDDGAAVLHLKLRWFGQPYRATQFEPGTELVVAGRMRRQRATVYLVVGECERARSDVRDPGLGIGRLVPVYPSIDGVGAAALRKLIRHALDVCEDIPELAVPARLASAHGLMPLREAIIQTHFPESHDSHRAARRRLGYQELLLLQLALARRRAEMVERAAGPSIDLPREAVGVYVKALPFALTGAQERAISEVTSDLAGATRAHRLLHGDVGSGKTVVAAWALWAAARAGRQAAMMAPTELLAEQHHRTIGSVLGSLGVEPLLLTGSMPAGARANVIERLRCSQPVIVVGTHALFQESVEFSDLAVVVIDEQHRFGLQQRAALADKGTQPHVLVMSATPIPRTLALTLYGDFDISVIDELPPGRRPVRTMLVEQTRQDEVMALLGTELSAGRQAYVICPLIEQAENGDREAAIEVHDRLREELAGHDLGEAAVGMVHGRMSSEQRSAVMEQFRDGRIGVLVSTTVVEVGVDVPNATVMVVLNAERFGLAQLHQLRGRVARSSHQAHCLLVTGSESDDVLDRLGVLEQTADGFVVAEEDLMRRGPGELAGLAQHGLPDVHMASLLTDTPTLVAAREDARKLLQVDPDLQMPQHRPLRQMLAAQQNEAGAGWTI